MKNFLRLEDRRSGLNQSDVVAGSTCYFCGNRIDRDHATVTVPRLALTVHSICYERDAAAGQVVSRAIRAISKARAVRRRA